MVAIYRAEAKKGGMSCERHWATAPGDAPECPYCNPAPIAPDTWNELAWRARGAELAKSDNDTRWQLGDWLLEAENKCDVYDAAEEITGLERNHLQDMASVAKRIPSCVRDTRLSWTHHRHVSNGHKKDEPELTPEQMKEWLDKAVAGKWSVRQLDAELHPPPTGTHPKETISVTMKVPPAIHTTLRCFAAADKLRAAASLDRLPITSIDGSVPLNPLTAHMATENFKLVRKEIGACASNITAKEVSAVATKLLLEYLNAPNMAHLVAETREFAMPTGRAARRKKRFRKAASAARKAERKAESAVRKAARKAAERAEAERASREAEARKAEKYARSQDHRRLRISFKSNPEDKARKLLEALPDAAALPAEWLARAAHARQRTGSSPAG